MESTIFTGGMFLAAVAIAAYLGYLEGKQTANRESLKQGDGEASYADELVWRVIMLNHGERIVVRLDNGYEFFIDDSWRVENNTIISEEHSTIHGDAEIRIDPKRVVFYHMVIKPYHKYTEKRN